MTDDGSLFGAPAIRAYAQYMADYTDVSIFLSYTVPDFDIQSAGARKRIDEWLRDEGWCGRKYPVDFFRADTVDMTALSKDAK